MKLRLFLYDVCNKAMPILSNIIDNNNIIEQDFLVSEMKINTKRNN